MDARRARARGRGVRQCGRPSIRQRGGERRCAELCVVEAEGRLRPELNATYVYVYVPRVYMSCAVHARARAIYVVA